MSYLMSLAGVSPTTRSLCMDNHFQKHQGPHCVCKQSIVPESKASCLREHCGHSPHFTHTDNHRLCTKPRYGLQ